MIVEVIEYANNVSVEVKGVVRISIAEHNIPPGISAEVFTQKGEILVGTGDGTYFPVPPGEDGTFLQFDSAEPAGVKATVPTLEVEDATNYALNGGFDFVESLLAPTTLTTIADGGYAADQWKCYRENADLQFRQVDASSESGLTSPFYGEFKKITNAGKILICQPFDYLNTVKFRGRTVGYQLKMKSNAARTMKIAVAELQTGGTADTIPAVVSSWNADGTNPTLGANLALIGTPVDCSVTTAWTTFQFTGAFPSNSKNLLLLIWTNADMAAGDTLGVGQAGLYYGTSIRSWNPRMMQDELRLLQWYYYLHCKGNSQPVGMGALRSASIVCVNIQFPTKMRIAPSLDMNTGTNFYYQASSSNDSFSSLTISFISQYSAELINATEISGTAGDSGPIRTQDASAKIGFNARL